MRTAIRRCTTTGSTQSFTQNGKLPEWRYEVIIGSSALAVPGLMVNGAAAPPKMGLIPCALPPVDLNPQQNLIGSLR